MSDKNNKKPINWKELTITTLIGLGKGIILIIVEHVIEKYL
jgi:hypothetical protein